MTSPMNRIALSLAAASFALLASPALSQTVPAPAAAPAKAEDLVKVTLDTSAGRIVLALDRGRAPITTANFLHYVDAGRYNGIGFYRAMTTHNGGLIQAGITDDARKMFAPIAHESTLQTGIKNQAGTIAFANAGPGTARSHFFIMVSDFPSLDATATDPGFAAFGHVVEGMEVVKAILAAPVSSTKGAGAMKGQMLEPVVKITKAARLAKTP
ncbi:MAG: peptidylprolyl isomerase [Sphingomicrobium sp.]